MAAKLQSDTSKKHAKHLEPCSHMLIHCKPCNEVYCTNCETVFTPAPTMTFVDYEVGDDLSSPNTCIVVNDDPAHGNCITF